MRVRRMWIATVLSVLWSCLSSQSVAADLRLALPFGEGMILQRDTSMPFWGTAEAGRTITVRFRGSTASAPVDAHGRWHLELSPSAAGGPFELTVDDGREELRFEDVLVGDVWVCSGQSNMEWVVADSMNAGAEIDLAADARIRHFKVPRSWASRPVEALAGGSWAAAQPEAVGSFTAVGYFFAREVRRHHDIPIGLINTTWGGSRIEAWMSAESLGFDERDMEEALAADRAYEEEVRASLEARIGTLPAHDAGLVDNEAVWASPDLDDSRWAQIVVPSAWENAGYPGMDGVAWYRTTFDLTQREVETGIVLGLGMIDDSDTTWVNGQWVGRTEMAWNRPRAYEVPSSVLRSGRNVIAIRVEDTGGGGGIQGNPALLYVDAAGQRRSLSAPWRFALGQVTVNTEDHKREVPAVLYNHMVHPLLQLPIRGVLWYQGESNAGTEDARVYGDQFADLITSWRAAWGQPELPFLFVQLASFMAPPMTPQESSWALLRESQSKALALMHTAQAVTIDAGDTWDVHPRNKQIVGHRLALAARNLVYGESIEHSGPVYRQHHIEGSRMVIHFDHVGGGLIDAAPAGETLRGFAIAGADQEFVWADARIVGDTVVVWSDSVPQPVAVRYAWADNPEGANLLNRGGLPASPFRTDSW